MLSSPITLEITGFQKLCIRNWSQRPNIRTKDTPSAPPPITQESQGFQLCQEGRGWCKRPNKYLLCHKTLLLTIYKHTPCPQDPITHSSVSCPLFSLNDLSPSQLLYSLPYFQNRTCSLVSSLNCYCSNILFGVLPTCHLLTIFGKGKQRNRIRSLKQGQKRFWILLYVGETNEKPFQKQNKTAFKK